MATRCSLHALVLVTLTLSAAEGQNLLANPGFVDDLEPWVDLLEGEPPLWDPATASGPPGSALLTNNASSAGESQVSLGQCVVVEPSTAYSIRGKYLIPPGQSRTGKVALSQSWHIGQDCGPMFQGFSGTSFADTVGSWSSLRRSFTTNSFTESVHFQFLVNKNEEGGTFQAHFDDAVLEVAAIFADGFESGDTTRWD